MLGPLMYSPTANVTIIVTATPDFIYEETSASTGITSETITFSASGGTGPYTYHTVGTGSIFISPVSPNAATTGFSYLGLNNMGDSINDNFTCTATDAHGATGYVIAGVTVQRTS